MGLGKMLKDNQLKIGNVSGHLFGMNTMVKYRDLDEEGKGISFKMTGGKNIKLVIANPECDEFEFGHEDVASACICCSGEATTSNGKQFYIKYRVVLKDGKDFIITTNDITSSYTIERVLF